jgi:hypothetical protein
MATATASAASLAANESFMAFSSVVSAPIWSCDCFMAMMVPVTSASVAVSARPSAVNTLLLATIFTGSLSLLMATMTSCMVAVSDNPSVFNNSLSIVTSSLFSI